ncbi:MAG: hypothetical protein P4L53_25855 [Candidatus Obscuribacterales bacterium]|nr:hypothetical protein [Candidatus Obscuribacterales bacterium]
MKLASVDDGLPIRPYPENKAPVVVPQNCYFVLSDNLAGGTIAKQLDSSTSILTPLVMPLHPSYQLSKV